MLYYYHANSLCSIIALTDDSGALIESIEYDVYGLPTVTVEPGKTATGNRYLFTGREWDSETGLYHYRARAYNPQIGRFLQRDAIELQPEYLYALSNPVVFDDPTGLWAAAEHNTETMEAFYGNIESVLQSTHAHLCRPCQGRVYATISRANMGQDSGEAYSNPIVHYTFDHRVSRGSQTLEELAIAADKQYDEYTLLEHDKAWVQIQAAQNCYKAGSVPQCRQWCEEALKSYGRLLHSYQDFYAHAVNRKLGHGAKGVWDCWTKGITGDPWHREKLRPCSFHAFLFPPRPGEHGYGEAGGREGAIRRQESGKWSKESMKKFLEIWVKACRCCWHKPSGLCRR